MTLANYSVSGKKGGPGGRKVYSVRYRRISHLHSFCSYLTEFHTPFICHWQRSSFLTLFEIVAFLRLRSLRLFLTESHSPFTCHRQRSSFLTLFEIVAFLRLRSLLLFLTESHSPFTCHRQRSSLILRNFERCPSPRVVIKICITANLKPQNFISSPFILIPT